MDYGFSYVENTFMWAENKRLKMWQDKLKKELATREHIPNKKESRELRIQRKKSGIPRKKKKS